MRIRGAPLDLSDFPVERRRRRRRLFVSALTVVALTSCAAVYSWFWDGCRSEQALTIKEAQRIMVDREPGEEDKVSPAIMWSYHTIKKLAGGVAACREEPGNTGLDARIYWRKCKALFEEESK